MEHDLLRLINYLMSLLQMALMVNFTSVVHKGDVAQ